MFTRVERRPGEPLTTATPRGYNFTFVYTIKCSLGVILERHLTSGWALTVKWEKNAQQKTRETPIQRDPEALPFKKPCDLPPRVNTDLSVNKTHDCSR